MFHVYGSFVPLANVDDGVSREHDIRVAEIGVAFVRLVPGDDPGGVANDGGLIHCLPAYVYDTYDSGRCAATLADQRTQSIAEINYQVGPLRFSGPNRDDPRNLTILP